MLLLSLLAACQTSGTLTVNIEDTGPDTGPFWHFDTNIPEPDTDGQCGEVSEHTVQVVGVVHDGSGDGAADAAVRLEDRGWNPGTTLGAGTTNAGGEFELDGLAITSVEDCWGTLLDYVIVAERGGQRVERGINSQLRASIFDATLDVDLTSLPLVLE